MVGGFLISPSSDLTMQLRDLNDIILMRNTFYLALPRETRAAQYYIVQLAKCLSTQHHVALHVSLPFFSNVVSPPDQHHLAPYYSADTHTHVAQHPLYALSY